MTRVSSVLLLLIVAACSLFGTGPRTAYSILIKNPSSTFYDCGGGASANACPGETWTVSDSVDPTAWFAPAQGGQGVFPGGTWCVHPPTSEQVVAVTVVFGAGLTTYTGYAHLSSNDPSWTTARAFFTTGPMVVSPGPPC